MRRWTWYRHHLKQFLHRRIDQFRTEDPMTALRDTARHAWMGTLSAVGPRFYRGVPIWQHDWDVFVVLDACRVDALCELAASGEFEFLPRPDAIETTTSVGSATAEWMNATYAPTYAADCAHTAYVSANPHTASDHGGYANLPLESDAFALLDEVWKTEWCTDGTPTVHPRPVTEHAVATWRRRETIDADRLIVHYMQPHRPYRSFEYEGGRHPDETTVGAAEATAGRDQGLWDQNYWEAFVRGELDRETIWRAYLDNLRWVLEDLSVLVENVTGRVVISADHGEAFGEWGVYEHPPRSPVPVLRKVPYVSIEATDEESIDPDPPILAERDVDESTRQDRLRSLGYVP